ncbi:MAG: hypothetical protein O7A06_07505, partial [Acidobacteria bacterium]|nr:hypothetical protein [Acidobacteriota bacterium]
MRRFTRLTNAFSKKIENHAAAVALFWYCQVKANSPVVEAKTVCSGTKNQQLRDCYEALTWGSNR